MARPRGSRNARHDAQRAALVRKVFKAVQADDGVDLSLRSLAAAAKTSVATMRHYFGDRLGVLRAVIESIRVEAAPHLAIAAQPIIGDVRGSLLRLLQGFHMAWYRHGVGKMYASTLSLGLGHRDATGGSFVQHVLEPLIQTGEQLLRAHQERRELELPDVRHASLVLLSPVLLALLHQDSLDGAAVRPLDVPAMLELQVDAFLRAYGAETVTSSA